MQVKATTNSNVLGVLGAMVALVVAAMPAAGQVAYQRLLDLGTNSPTGYRPNASLVEGPDGVLYGTTFYGNSVYRINKDGTGFRAIGFVNAGPYADVVIGPDDALYGTTSSGGFSGGGTVFKLNRDGTGFRVLDRLTVASPVSYLLLGDDGAFYGTLRSGGAIFKIHPDGTGLNSLNATNIDDLRAGLIKDSRGTLYGVSFFGAAVFRINQDGSGFSVLHGFQGEPLEDGFGPHARLVEASDGFLYGTTQYGGISLTPSVFYSGYGTIFKVRPDGTGYSVLHRFDPDLGQGAFPYSHLVEGTNGALYGTTLADTLFRINKDASDFAVLHTFGSEPEDGLNPHCGLLKASDGVLYGTTVNGGIDGQGTIYQINQDGSGYRVMGKFLPERPRQTPRALVLHATDGRLYCATEDAGSTNFGSIFSIERNGTDFALLHDFGATADDGRIPNALDEASDGWIYGTTQSGGTNNGGTLFKINKTGTNYVVLRRFATPAEGLAPRAGVIEGSDGWIYGTLNIGGSSGRGTLFKVRKDGSDFSVIWSFLGGATDGGAPQGELLEGTNGALYGTTRLFGSAGRGVVYRIDKDGANQMVLHHFTGGDDGQNPLAGLVAGSDGVLYGTTQGGPSSTGTVFAIHPDGSGYRVLRTFGTAGTEPRNLRGGLAEGADGWLYGTTYQGGSNSFGTMFALAKDGSNFRVVWHFGNETTDGRSPVAGPTVANDGVLYGCTEAGGSLGMGTFYRLDPRSVGLNIERHNSDARVRWPVSGTRDQLEQATTLSRSNVLWTVADTPVSAQGDEYQATLPLDGTNRFLRVRREWK